MHQFRATVVKKQEITSDIFKLTLFAPPLAHDASPGQFVHLQCGQDQTHILRRPFSIHQIVGTETIDILIKTVGQGTAWLAARSPKDAIDTIGPLGRGFQIDNNLRKALLVAGGMGIAPMVLLAQRLFENKVRAYTAIGAASRLELLDFMELKRLTHSVAVATEDGSQGHAGLVTDLIKEQLEEIRPDLVYACGPESMLRKVAELAAEHDVGCQVSMEARMACGVGACLGCAVKGADRYLNVCSDGPVFEIAQLGWPSA